ncbi:MAG: class I SAM-dependent methyltransferase [Caulobacteraceae bacterium]|nr:class I SAM-dependent methyltransferase [Caulobacteraceae bacterium]
MNRLHESIVDDQFGPRAFAYVTSAVHSSGADLDAIEALAHEARPPCALDLGSGGGHVAYRLAPHALRVVAADISARMLAAVADTASGRGLTNIETRVAAAERLPFPDDAFDLLASRFSAHHWGNLHAGLAEARRVLRHGAPAVFVDIVSPGSPALDTHLQAVEILRDTSHVRDYALAEWISALERANFSLRRVTTWRVAIDFASWIERMATPGPAVAAILGLQAAACEATRCHFAILPDGSFELDAAMIEAV